jgi:glycosyltransferase involved in cell wall biosynthesis
MKSVLFLSSWYPSRVHTTLGNFVGYHAKAVSLKNNVNILYIVPDDNIKNYEFSHFKKENVTTTIVYFKRGTIKYFNYWKAFKKGIDFLINQKKLEFDVVHMNIMYPGVWQAVYLNWKYKLQFIVSENWHGFQNLSAHKISFIKRLMLKYAFKKAHSICPVSHQLKDGMIKEGFKSNYKVIPNVVDTDLFTINHKKNDYFTFLHISTLDDSIKNVSGIIKAFSQLNDSKCKLKIIGDGKTDWIFELVKNYQLEDRIIIEGEKTYEEIAQEMQMANVFILFSNIENLPLVLIEAMSSGLPTIVTKVGGIPEIYDNELGLLIEKKDINSLLNSMNIMLDNYSHYNSNNIRNYAIKYFSYEQVCNQFNILYDQMVSK